MVETVQVVFEDAVEKSNKELTQARIDVQEHIRAAFSLLKRFTEKANLEKYRHPDTSIQSIHADVEQDKMDRFLISVGIREVIVMPEEAIEEGNKKIRRRNRERPTNRPNKEEAWVYTVEENTYRF